MLWIQKIHHVLDVFFLDIQRNSKDKPDECEGMSADQWKIDRIYVGLALEDEKIGQGRQEGRVYSRFGLFEL